MDGLCIFNSSISFTYYFTSKKKRITYTQDIFVIEEAKIIKKLDQEETFND